MTRIFTGVRKLCVHADVQSTTGLALVWQSTKRAEDRLLTSQ